MVEWGHAPRILNLRRGLLMLAVIGIHAGIGGVWAQHSLANISFDQPGLEMVLDFSSAEANESEQPHSKQLQSEQSASEQPIESTAHQVVQPEPKPEPKPEADLEYQIKTRTKKIVPKNEAYKPLAQNTKSPQIKTSTGTTQKSGNHAPLSSQFVRLSQLTIDGSPPVPHYPKQSRLKGEEGLVVVRISIDQWGGVETSHVFKSSGFELLDRAALDATTKIRFKPYQINSLSQRVRVDIPFNFILSP